MVNRVLKGDWLVEDLENNKNWLFNLEKKDREEDGKKIALFNSLGYLQLSIYRSNPQTVGSASTLFGLNYRDVVSVYF